MRNRYKLGLGFLLAASCMLLGTSTGWSQETAAAATAESKNFVQVFLSGGFTMWFLLIQSAEEIYIFS